MNKPVFLSDQVGMAEPAQSKYPPVHDHREAELRSEIARLSRENAAMREALEHIASEDFLTWDEGYDADSLLRFRVNFAKLACKEAAQ